MKYALYAWMSDNEGGYGICEANKFTPRIGYDPESGWRARPSVRIGEFDTAEQLAAIMVWDDPGMFANDVEAVQGARLLMNMCGFGGKNGYY